MALSCGAMMRQVHPATSQLTNGMPARLLSITRTRRDQSHGRVEQGFDATGLEAFRLDGKPHHPAVAHCAQLIGEQVGGYVLANRTLPLAFREHRGEDIAIAGVAPLINSSERRFVARMGQQLERRHPFDRAFCAQRVEPTLETRPDIDAPVVTPVAWCR